MLVSNFTTKKILVDNDSSAYILFRDAFTNMGIGPNQLRPSPMPFKGFLRDMVQSMGTITLSILARKSPITAAKMADFLVVKVLLSYNVTLGQLTLNNLKAFTSTYHLKLKFLTMVGVGAIRG
ncbi:hypothetical protein I3760_12G025700 [Carya illinoinensis]|nr:hypothetical protein I3760_12G025700 [Carya illinoinensis]